MLSTKNQISAIVFLIIVCVVYFMGNKNTQKQTFNSPIEQLENVNQKAFGEIAEARGWDIANSRIGSLSVQYTAQGQVEDLLRQRADCS